MHCAKYCGVFLAKARTKTITTGVVWRKFLRTLDVDVEPDDTADEEAVQDWVEDAVVRFSQLKRFAELVRATSLYGESKHG